VEEVVKISRRVKVVKVSKSPDPKPEPDPKISGNAEVGSAVDKIGSVLAKDGCSAVAKAGSADSKNTSPDPDPSKHSKMKRNRSPDKNE
jgi:hypothetical protein